MFGGQLSDWGDLDGDPIPILPLTYPAGNDLYHEFHRLVMGQQRITGKARVAPNIAAMIHQVAENEGAIGYIPLSHVTEAVNVLAVDGVLPDAASMRGNSYPLRSTLFIIGREEPSAAWRSFFGLDTKRRRAENRRQGLYAPAMTIQQHGGIGVQMSLIQPDTGKEIVFIDSVMAGRRISAGKALFCCTEVSAATLLSA